MDVARGSYENRSRPVFFVPSKNRLLTLLAHIERIESAMAAETKVRDPPTSYVPFGVVMSAMVFGSNNVVRFALKMKIGGKRGE